MTRIVFGLDFDGVVTCLEENEYSSRSFGATALRNINKLGEIGDIVLTSSWRYGARLGDPKDWKHSWMPQEAIEFMKHRGVTTPLVPSACIPEIWAWGYNTYKKQITDIRRKYDIVDVHLEKVRRGDEFLFWLDKHMPDALPQHYVFLDDEADYHQEQLPRLVQTNELKGFDDEAFTRTMQLLGRSS